MAFLRRFVVKDSVEGVLEVRLELADAIGSYGARLRRGLLLTAVATCLAMASAAPGGIAVIRDIWRIFQGSFDATLAWVALSAEQAFVMGLVWALGITILVFLVQSTRFVGVLRGRYSALERLGLEGPPAGGDGEPRRHMPAGDLPADPAMAMVGLARDVEEQVPQLDRMLKFGSMYALLLWGVLIFQTAITALGIATVPPGWAVPVVALMAVSVALITVSAAALIEILYFLRYYTSRARSLEAFVAMAPCAVPPGPDAIAKYLGCLQAQGVIEASTALSRPAELEGRDGRHHGFDAAAGGPGDRVLVRSFPRMPALDEVRALRDAAEDVARRDGALPRRVIALVLPGEAGGGEADLPDELYQLLLDSPIMDPSGTWARTVQVVCECEGHYCPVPFIAPDDR